MAGLLPSLGRASLLTPRPIPRATPEDEAMAARFLASQGGSSSAAGLIPMPAAQPPTDPQMGFGGLLSQAQALPAPQQQMPARERGRVNPARILSRFILGGEDPFQATDAERTRLQAEADAPRALAEQRRLQSLAAQYGPLGELAWNGNREKAGEAFASNLEGYSLSAGGVRGGVNGLVAGAPTTSVVNDEIYQNDPMARTSTRIATANPGYDDLTQRQNAETQARKAEMDYEIQRGQLGVNQGRLTLDEQNAGFTLGPNGQRYDRFGNLVAQGLTPPRAANPADNNDRAAIEGYNAVNDRFSRLLTSINGDPEAGTRPEFNLTPLAAAGYKAALRTGIGMSPEAAAYGDYVSEIKSAVADALRLNVGPQTDQDAIREAEALLLNIDNGDYVRRRLPTVISNNERLAAGRQTLMQQRGTAAGGQSSAPAQGGQGGAAPVRVTTPQEAQALPPGTQFVTPDGQVRVRR